EVRALNSQDFRRLFGYDRVKSTNFELTFSDNGLDLKGRGHGHGAGMCQKGARFMALAGANFFDILKRYYPNARIKRPPVLAKGELSTHPKSVSN
ncbi:MAG: hypothetical protein KDD33_13965, partial [Bdellovibrionales bacterium]|nr:hypothetical protein [Bdellovibrionales bacterium]